ncbi:MULTISPECIES: YbhB/YbcL family Raf kinase inhibitor-like protein [unclassified Oceanispirochaeta]|uniref:YbhB/YbcL family Raf kinase inhibitor-like protein n=1 Tax=unclassified Oceanispirochaeta TaxID=2635722 RepID=UPI000E094B00|nr:MULTISPECIES: YbhB/YbcL family Raf kinase inhibitor-like protein [unclassified Oceanispirochaeta]MBF9019023.1 YbhB/YbcL family Raf kinase inhibitor-like protein [Oceanispirochaeta sp. M2]NPD75525.1 YbhB/YbcL family Raf kinase inhibitor-like protein [Oceanispirochaeta sp. M1]RDG28621.1 YbhB/YbcL family Raf kinase inhibitor-like protein [Oceanispirochaeta sp. M1]
MSYEKRITTLLIFMNMTLALFSETKSVENILEEYNSEEITRNEAIEIMETLKEAGYKPGPILDQLIDDQGFDSFKLKELSPPPGNINEDKLLSKEKGDRKHNSGKIYPTLEFKFENTDFSLTSSAVIDGELQEEFKGEEKINGIEKSIPLKWDNVPEGTTSLAVIMYHYPRVDDKSSVNTYLLLWNIKPSVTEIKHGEADDGEWCMGSNKDGNTISYTSPNSPSAGEHVYQISIFALSQPLKNLPEESSLEVDFDLFMSAIESNEVVGKADLIFKDINH